ncbi:MAG: hypothetical protein WBD76_14575 [Methyloceanibacter sp.]|jgi:hypothetical protein
MLAQLRTGLGFRVAVAAAIVAALCFVVPPAAMAFGHGDNTMQCLAHAESMAHGRQGSAEHEKHGDHAKLPGAQSCCGLFCLSAITPASPSEVELLFVAPVLALPAELRLSSRIPEFPDRPPILPLSV